ncbi:retrovirus-related pol polyprotein LINE-1 [Tanacetum coccineum]
MSVSSTAGPGRIEAVGSDGHLRSCPSGLGGVVGCRETRRYDILAGTRRIRVGTWKVGSLIRKRLELADALGRPKVDIACFQETKWKGSSTKEGNGYKLWYSDSSSRRNGVGVILTARLKDNIVKVKEILGRTGRDCEECLTDQHLFIGGNLNGHIGTTADGYAGVHGGFGFRARKEEGRAILEFATAHDLVVANSFFKKMDAHLITFQSGSHNTQIDYLLVRRGDLRTCKDCRAFPSEACSSQHRLVTFDVLFERQRHRREAIGRARILWKNLKGDVAKTFKATVSKKLSALEEDISTGSAEQMWNTLAHTIKDVAMDSLGVVSESARTHSTHRETWWFSEEVQTKVAEKQSRFKELLSCLESNLEDIDSAKERYKLTKIEAKIAVARAKDKAYEDLYTKLDSKEGANDIYKIAKARERRRRDLGNVRYIKDEGGREVGSASPHLPQDCYYSKINQREVRIALQKMGRNKVVGPDQIPIEAWKCLKNEGVKWLTCLFNKIFSSAKMHDEWRLSKVIPIYKNKGDMQACGNYRGIKLLSHTMKLWEKVIKRRLRRETRVTENQFRFMPRRSTTDAIHLLRSLIEKYRERQRDLHMAFLNLEMDYNSIPRELVWRTLIDNGAPGRYLRVLRDMYKGAKTHVRTSVRDTEFFPIEVGLHQGSAISPYLFALILDEILRGIQEDILWCMIFADDIVLIAESAKGLNSRLEKWRKALEDKGLRISRDKTEYLRCDFGRYEVVHQEVEIRIGDWILQPKESFRYLGSMIHRSGRVDDDVAHRIRAGWVK